MASQGPSDCSTVTNTDLGASFPWSNVNNAKVQDSTDTTNAIGDGFSTDALDCTNYGFTIPSGATIDGVIVSIRRKCSGANGNIADDTIQLIIGGSPTGNNKSTGTGWTTTYASATFGSSTDKWGLTPTVSQVNASDFGVRIVSAGGNGVGGTAGIDSVRITVHYTEAAGAQEQLIPQTTITMNCSVTMKVRKAEKPQEITSLNCGIGLPVRKADKPQTMITLNDNISVSNRKGVSPQEITSLNGMVAMAERKGVKPETLILLNDSVSCSSRKGIDLDSYATISGAVGLVNRNNLIPKTSFQLNSSISISNRVASIPNCTVTFNDSITLRNIKGFSPQTTIILSNGLSLGVKKSIKPETLIQLNGSVSLGGLNLLDLNDVYMEFKYSDGRVLFIHNDYFRNFSLRDEQVVM